MTAGVERELRQLRLASATLNGYRNRDIGLGTLISDLDALWNEFQLQSDAWLDAFRGHWWTLEQFHAVAIDRGISEMPDDFQVAIEEAVDQLGFAVDEALARVDED